MTAMKHILSATTGIALVLAVAGTMSPAAADVDVHAFIHKDKDITVIERITVTKNVGIAVASVFVLPAAAEAQAVMNITNDGSEVNGTDASQPTSQTPDHTDDYNIHLHATAVGSINENTGVWGFNQDVGNMTNQGNVVSVAGIADELFAVADAQAHADQKDTNNTSTEFEKLKNTEGDPVTITEDINPSTFLVNKEALLDDSVNGNTGVINVNQNAGNMNNQTNGVAAAIGEGAVVALSDADLGQLNSGNHVDELETVKTATINGSINGNTGVVNVNQSTGNMNNQGNVVSIAAITSGAFINTNSAP
jgi:hypothetical protein